MELAIFSLLYFAPAYIAWRRRHPSMWAIIVVSILGGWTVIGWFVTLGWSLAAIRREAYK